MWPRVNGMRGLELGTPGELRSRLNGLVLAGKKRATTGLLDEYRTETEGLEYVGERLALLDDEGAALATVEITDITLSTFAEVTWAHAEAEGEGDADLDAWRAGHARFWTSVGTPVTEDTPLVCLAFRLV
ncbi:ASCH domain-containing protein [Streptomyces sp. NPDC097619]|uniref:ASCH domain-containing protein n=1 Tax=Streptomyces sp. NPDC097619 TaxID=3157228 RepID=UPI00332763F4